MLRKALAAKLPVILLVNKTDRPDARIDEVVAESQDLLLGLASDLSEEVEDLDLDAILNVPVVYASGRNGAASINKPADGSLPDNADLEPLFDAILTHVPAPTYDDEHPPAGARHQPRRVAVPRSSRAPPRVPRHPEEGADRRLGQAGRHHGQRPHHRAADHQGPAALPAESAGPGDIVAVAGFDTITIGETLSDPDDVRPLPTITVDDPRSP